ncbi:MAG: hypothetical protein HOO86_01810 [Bacteroidales bacterium]|nr:hypothetical protein [Bacteroidales bacterium]
MDNDILPIDPSEIVHLKHIDEDLLLKRLSLFIYDLLQHNFEKLCALMYRHDVNEKLFNEALLLPNDEERAKAIARIVIEREMLKKKTREMYRAYKNENRLREK